MPADGAVSRPLYRQNTFGRDAVTPQVQSLPSPPDALSQGAYAPHRLRRSLHDFQHVADGKACFTLVSSTLSLPKRAAPGKTSGMKTIAYRLRAARQRKGLSQQDLGDLTGVSRAAVNQWEKKVGATTPTGPNLVAAANALGVEPEWLAKGIGIIDKIAEYSEQNIHGSRRMVPLLGVVQAGAFMEIEEHPEPISWVMDEVDARYDGLTRYALQVRGPSMNRVFRDGAVLICVPFHELGRSPYDGEYVDVIRREKTGLVERTVKQFVLYDGQPYLKPHSDHPDHQALIRLEDNGEEEAVSIRGRVIRAVTDF